MAITADKGILAMLKNFYAKEGLQNLLYRNDPLLKDIKKTRVEGKSANFSALYSRGGAVSANYTKAKELAAKTAQAKEFQVEPGQLFSACVFNSKELLASKTQRGAYTPIANAKFFANSEAFRKTLAVALYGTGHGELFTVGTKIDSGATSATFPKHAIMGIDVGSELVAKSTPSSTTVIQTLKVKSINDATVVFESQTTADINVGSVICLAGCTASDGTPLLPIGLEGWIPDTVEADAEFMGVKRAEARDRLAGSVITKEPTEKYYETIERAILTLRRMGSKCDKIVMNDEDFLELSKEIEEKTYFQKVDGGKKGKATVGYDGYGFAVSSNWLDCVIDSPYCPKGKAYVIDSDVLELWTYSNSDKVNDGIPGNEAGKPDVAEDGAIVDKPYQMIVDDLFALVPAETEEGPATLVVLQFFGNFVITNPSVCGKINFVA